MSYIKNNWVAPEGTNLNRYVKTEDGVEKSITLYHDPDFTNSPTKFTADIMNHMEQGIENAFDKTSDIMDDITNGVEYVKTHNDYTDAEKSKLTDIQPGAEVNVVDSVSGKTGDVVLNKSDVGLGNVPNIDCTNASNLSSGTVPSSVLPPIAITKSYTAANEAEQLALSAEEGDVCVRTDLSRSYIHNSGTAGTMADWTELQTPADTVLSVNSKTGTVVLNVDDLQDGTTYVRSHNDYTDAEKSNLGSLSDDSMADSLHRHSELSSSDGSINPALKVSPAGRVGIKTSSPDSNLHILTDGTYQGGITLYDGSSISSRFWTNGSGDLVLGHGASSNFVIDSAGNILVSGTVDGRDIAADGSKLDGIEASAFIKTSDTMDNILNGSVYVKSHNDYTDTDKNKVDTIFIENDVFDVYNNDTSDGTAINAAISYSPCYIGNDMIVYRNSSDGNKLYKKSINDTSNGTAINATSSDYPCYIGNDMIVYRNSSDGSKLYKKSVNDTSDGTAINAASSDNPCYIGNDMIVYRNNSDDGKLYKKSVNDTSDGTAINAAISYSPCYIGNDMIVYRNNSDGNKLYKKSVNDTSDGTAINAVQAGSMCYIGNDMIVYRNSSDGNKLYKKSINDTSNGTAINATSSDYPCYIGNDMIVYRNSSDGDKLYKKTMKIS